MALKHGWQLELEVALQCHSNTYQCFWYDPRIDDDEDDGESDRFVPSDPHRTGSERMDSQLADQGDECSYRACRDDSTDDAASRKMLSDTVVQNSTLARSIVHNCTYLGQQDLIISFVPGQVQ